MDDNASPESQPDYRKQFLRLLRTSLEQDTFVKLVLGKYKGSEAALKRIQVRRLVVKGQACLSFNTVYKTREMTKNVGLAEGVETVCDLVGSAFMSANLFSLIEDVQIEFSRKGKCFWNSGASSVSTLPSEGHNREKVRFLDQTAPFLAALGITDGAHQVIPSMARKWKQINKFLEIFQHAFCSSQIADARAVQLVDFGAGKGYLTFAIHDLLRGALGIEAQVVGVEVREDLVRFCNGEARRLALDGLSFLQGDVRSYVPDSLQVMIALHACDTATDQAIFIGIRAGAEIIMCAPCCHKQLRPQMRSPEVLEPILKFGIHLGQEAEMLTDSLRALLLEAHGYKTQLLEFVSLEHTSKNKMVLAIKHNRKVDRESIMARFEKLKAFYGIQEHCLETLLSADASKPVPKS